MPEPVEGKRWLRFPCPFCGGDRAAINYEGGDAVKRPTMRIGTVATAPLGAAYRLSEEFAGLDTVQEARKPGRRGLDPVEEPPYDVESRRQVHQAEDQDDNKRQRYPAHKPARRRACSWASLGDPPRDQDNEQHRHNCYCDHGYRPPPASRLLRDDQFSPTAWA